MRYRIGLTRRVFEKATVEVVASSHEMAEGVALQLAAGGGAVEWRFLGSAAEILSIDELPDDEEPVR